MDHIKLSILSFLIATTAYSSLAEQVKKGPTYGMSASAFRIFSPLTKISMPSMVIYLIFTAIELVWYAPILLLAGFWICSFTTWFLAGQLFNRFSHGNPLIMVLNAILIVICQILMFVYLFED